MVKIKGTGGRHRGGVDRVQRFDYSRLDFAPKSVKKDTRVVRLGSLVALRGPIPNCQMLGSEALCTPAFSGIPELDPSPYSSPSPRYWAIRRERSAPAPEKSKLYLVAHPKQ